MLPLFNSFIMEINSRCNRKCYFCPNFEYGKDRPDAFLSMETIKKCIKELKELKFKGRIEFQLFNEPLLDKRIFDTAKLIKEELPACAICINTNGDLLRTKKDIEDLLDNNIREIEVNIYDDIDRYKWFVKVIQEIKDSHVYDFKDCTMYKYVGRGYKVLYAVDKTQFKTLNSRIHKVQNRCGDISWFVPALSSPMQKICVRPFRMFNVDYKGRAVLCCNDYFSKVIFGDVSKEKIIDIWESDRLQFYRRKLIENNRELQLCDKCDFDGGIYAFVTEKQWRGYV